MMKKCNLTHLEELEAESIHVLRETAISLLILHCFLVEVKIV